MTPGGVMPQHKHGKLQFPCFFLANRETQCGDGFAEDCLHGQPVTCSRLSRDARAIPRRKTRSSRALFAPRAYGAGTGSDSRSYGVMQRRKSSADARSLIT